MTEGKRLVGVRARLTYANVMSSIAVFAALTGGVAWAHGKIGTQDLRNQAVTTSKLAGGAVTTPKLRNNAVRAAKLAPGSINSSKVLDGSLTGSDIDQATLDDVNAVRLGGNQADAFGSGLVMGRINNLNTGGTPDAYGFPVGVSTAGDQVAREMVVPVPILMRNFRVRVTAPPAGGSSRNFTVMVNDVNTLPCNITHLQTECTIPGPVGPVAAGSRLSIRSNIWGFPAAADALFGWRATMP